MSNICGIDRILKTEYNLKHFTRNCRIKDLDDFERDEANAYLWRVNLLNVKENMLHYEEVFGNVFERRESKCRGVLMKHYRKVKGEQLITFQMAQQIKTKNINVVLGNYLVACVKLNFC